MIRHNLAIGLGLVCLAAANSAQRVKIAAKQKPNVLLIVLDDLGTDKLEMYGETTPTCVPETCVLPPSCLPAQTACVAAYPATPNLDQLREGGILFSRAYASPVCSSSRAWLQTGRYGFRTGVGRSLSTVLIPGDYELPSSEVLLPELLAGGFVGPQGHRLGLPYTCGAFGKWHLTTTLTEDWNHAVENGYDRFYGTMGNVGNFFNYDKVSHDRGSAPNSEKIDGTATYTSDGWHGSITTRDALQWMQSRTNSFLAVVNYAPPHTPVQVPPSELLSAQTNCELTCLGLAPGDFLAPSGDPPEQLRLVFRALIEAIDVEIGKLIDGLPPAVRANTVILVMGDNGTPGWAVDEPPHDSLRAKGQVYELGARVPLLVSGSMVEQPVPPGGWSSDALVSATDIFLTIADITGADASQVVNLSELDSVSFLPVIEDTSHPGNRTGVFTQFFSPNAVLTVAPPSCYELNQRAISDGKYKYVRTQTSLSEVPCGTPFYNEEFFDLSVDPNEVANLLLGPLIPKAAAAFATLTAEMDALSGL